MNKLALLLLKTFVGPFVVTFIIALFILDMQFLWVYADDLMGKGLEGTVILELMIYASARLVNMALPLAILMSSIMTMGALAEHYELTAMKSAGQSLVRILRPLTIAIVFVAVSAFYFSNNVWPIANLKFRTLLYSVTKQKPALNLSDGVFYNGIDGFSIRVGRKDPKTDELTDVLIYDHRESSEGSRTVIRAQRGYMKQTEDKRYLLVTLEDGYSYDEQMESQRKNSDRQYPHVANQFEKQIMRIDLSSLSFNKADEDLFKNAYEMMTINQLEDAVDSIEVNIQRKQDDLERYGLRTMLFRRDSLAQYLPSNREEIEQVAIANDSLASDTSMVAVAESTALDTPPARKGMFASLSYAQQRRAVNQAIETSRSFQKSINNVLDDINSKRKLANKHEIEWHRKFFLAFSCVVLFFIGAPLGAIIRKGGLGLPTVVAIILFLVYYILTIFGERMVRSGSLIPVVGMWISSVILFPMSVFLTYKAATDSTIMNVDSYLNWFKKIFKRNKNADSATVQ